LTKKQGLPLSCTAPPASPRHPNPPPLRESGSSLKRHALADQFHAACGEERYVNYGEFSVPS